MKKLVILVIIVALLALTGCNKTLFDTTYNFNYAYINLGDEVIKGKVDNWTDYEDGDQLQVTIDGVTYLTSAANVVLVYDKNKE